MTIVELIGALGGGGAVGGALVQLRTWSLGRGQQAASLDAQYREAIDKHITRLNETIAQQAEIVSQLQERVSKLEQQLASAHEERASALADAEMLAQAKGELIERLQQCERDRDGWRDRATAAEATVQTLQEQLDHERAHHSER